MERDSAARIELTPIVVFLAFAIESYLNSIGARQLDIWDKLERLPWKKKVAILHKTAKRSIDWRREPLQFATEVFALAHGKPERIVGPMFKSQGEAERFLNGQELEPDWYSKITREWIVEAKERFRLLMTHLGELFGLHESDHLLAATGGLFVHNGKDA